MSLDLDDKLDRKAARTVRLAGRDFTVAPLSLRQILAIADFVPKLSAIGAEQISGERIMPLAEVLWHGLRRAHPRLAREEFFDLPITIAELVAALPVVIEQAGGKPVAGLERSESGDAAAGETVPGLREVQSGHAEAAATRSPPPGEA